jgi:hypothetical protein
MKNKLLLVVFGLLMTTQMILAQVPSYVPTSGLVGYWPFNGNANDQSVNGNNGTVNGATLTTDRFGNSNNAYSFDGNNDHIVVSNNSTLSGFADITISLWVNISQFPSASNSFSGLVTKWYGSGNCGGMTDNYACYLRTNNQFVAGTNQYRNYPNMLQSPSNLSSSNWYHLVIVHNSTTGGSIYINGSLVSTYNTSGALCSSTNPLYFGCDNGLGVINRFFNGKLDDIGIWNRALTQQEITNMYNGVNYSDTCNAVSGSLVNGLVGYWPFCGNANDQSGNGNNGTVNGATLTTDRFGNTNSAYNFDGVNDYISTNYSGILGINSRSISFWYNSNSNNIEETVFTGYGENNCGAGFACTLFPLNKPAVDNTCSWIKSVNSTTINSWNFYTITYTSSDGSDLTNCKIYINGVLQSTSQNSTLYDINTINGLNMVFGSSILFYPNQFFNGKLDDIGIWNRALTQQEITQLLL